MAIFPGSAITPAGGGYTIDQSLRFNDDDSAYLSRTPASAGNRKTWTWSGWVKRANISSSTNALFNCTGGSGDTGFLTIAFNASQKLLVGAVTVNFRETTAVYRDVSAWYHIVVAVDTTQATSSNRVKLYVNGEQVTSFSSSNDPTQNSDLGINQNLEHRIGRYNSDYAHFYLTEVNFIDGQALDPSSFGEADETYGHWKPIEYTGTYGTNGFYLPFSGTFYNDASGNGNNWTANNLATTDVVLDSPTNNFCTWNPLAVSAYANSWAEGNLKATTVGTGAGASWGTFGIPSSGKWYWEVTKVSGDNPYIGVGEYNYSYAWPTEMAITTLVYAAGNGNKWINGSSTAYGATYTNGDIIGVAVDADAGTVTFYKNNSSQGGITYDATGLFPILSDSQSASGAICVANFGQDSSFAGNKTAQNNTDDNGVGDFYYAPPSGYLALCTANLPDPAVVPGENFNTVTYTGTLASQYDTQSITGVGFQPDFTWIKHRGTILSHVLTDSVRGVSTASSGAGNKALRSDGTNAEGALFYGYLTSFDSDGFSISDDNTQYFGLNVGNSGASYVAWNWKADNTSGSSNTDGSITSTVAANVDAGFSIVSYTGTGSNATVGHGLSSAPEMVIVKNRSTSGNHWRTWHKNFASGYQILLNENYAAWHDPNQFNSTAPTSSVFYVGGTSGDCDTNDSGDSHIAYCFHSVDGYSKFGSYTGNGSTDGPFVYTGFRPKFVMIKKSSGADDWSMWDDARSPYNIMREEIFANDSAAENTDRKLDFVSNGFKVREGTYTGTTNTNGATYIYMAFAECPTKFANAR